MCVKRGYYRGDCEICGEPIDLEDSYYVMPEGELVCEDCLTEWAEQYHRVGEVGLGFEDDDRDG